MGTATADGTRVETQAESDALVARAFEAWLERWQRTRARPFFAWVHFYDVHKPYAPPADCGRAFVGDYRGRLRGASDDELGAVIDHSTLARQPLDDADRRYVLALYDGAIRCIDDHVARMLAALDRHGLADTMVIVTSDHGEELGDHHHYYYHGNSVYGSTLRVPLVIRWPGRVPAGRTIEQLTQNVDLLPTILDLLGAPVPPDVEGVSVAGLLTGEDAGRAAPRQAVFTEWQNLIVGVRTPRFSYVLNPTGAHPKKPPFYGAHTRGFPVECEELYALDEDPAEQRNRHGELADIEASLRAQAMDFRERSGVVSDWQSVEDAAVVQNLEALGYVATTRTRDDVIVGAVRCR
jgi:arylsulfatase A-like enzyme